MNSRDLRALLRGRVLLLPAGTAAMATGLLPLALPWPARLVIGAAGAVLCALSLPAACRWVRDGADEGGL